ncbi:MAG: ATP-binding protein [Candidatus Metalachnospira sp.]|nr:ATP-binding protein [Candidatus Metalachnospira sp.]
MRFYVPQLTFNDSLSFENSLPDNISDNEVIFDFSKMTNFDPLPMLLIGSIIRRYRNNYPDVGFFVDGFDGDGKDYAGTMGFFKYISPSLHLGKMPGEANGSTNYIPITPLVVDELQKAESEKGNYLSIGNLIENESSRMARIVDRGNPELHKLLTYLIREILRNTPEHAQSNQMWVCGQYWSSYNLAEIAIIDEGIGIYNSITKNAAHREYIVNNAAALQWALKAGISQAIAPSKKQTSNDEWANSGFGLYMVSEICKNLNGSFCIISYDNYLLIDNHGVNEGKTSFHGTAIRIRVPSDRIKNAQEIISTIAQQGEAEAKTIRNAFKKASTPTKGLMDYLNTK